MVDRRKDILHHFHPLIIQSNTSLGNGVKRLCNEITVTNQLTLKLESYPKLRSRGGGTK